MEEQIIKLSNGMRRQKIEIFSKRCAGLFKKASELAILCGAQVAAVVFSPAGKAFSFGHPSVEFLIDRFLASSSSFPPGPGDASSGAVPELNRQYGDIYLAYVAVIEASCN